MKRSFVLFLLVLISPGQCLIQDAIAQTSTALRLQPVIDMHMHVYSEKSFVNFGNVFLGPPADNKNDVVSMKASRGWTDHLREIASEMNKNNVVLGYASGDFQVLDYIKENYPGRFFPSAQIWPTRESFSDPGYTGELRRRLKNKEILGLGEVLNFYTGIAPNDPVMDTIYRMAQEYDVPVCMHFAPGPTGIQQWGELFRPARYRYSNPLLLEDVLVRYPKLRISLMHAGVPAFTEETFAMFYMFPNVYADIGYLPEWSFYFRASLENLLKKAVEYGFTDRIMFGSDEMWWPSAISIGVEFIKNADYLTEKQKEDILYNNAARFLRLPEQTMKKP